MYFPEAARSQQNQQFSKYERKLISYLPEVERQAGQKGLPLLQTEEMSSVSYPEALTYKAVAFGGRTAGG